MVWQFGFGDAVNILTFFSLGFSSYIVFYFSQKFDSDKQVNMSIFILALGLNFIGLSHLFRIGANEQVNIFVDMTAVIGSLFVLIGFILMSYQKRVANINLRLRYNELNSVIKNLKDKYYKQEISEEDLKSVHSGLIKELSELEVKMKDGEKTKKHK